MSWLYIDTATTGTCRFGVLTAKQHSVEAYAARSGKVLPFLERRLGRARIRRMKGICVVSGPGSFSSVRGGVLIANLLARLFRLPLVGVSVDETLDLSVLEVRLRNGSIPTQSFVAPVYDAEPNITRPSA